MPGCVVEARSRSSKRPNTFGRIASRSNGPANTADSQFCAGNGEVVRPEKCPPLAERCGSFRSKAGSREYLVFHALKKRLHGFFAFIFEIRGFGHVVVRLRVTASFFALFQLFDFRTKREKRGYAIGTAGQCSARLIAAVSPDLCLQPTAWVGRDCIYFSRARAHAEACDGDGCVEVRGHIGATLLLFA